MTDEQAHGEVAGSGIMGDHIAQLTEENERLQARLIEAERVMEMIHEYLDYSPISTFKASQAYDAYQKSKGGAE